MSMTTTASASAHPLRVGYVSFGRPTFDLEAANAIALQSVEVLKRKNIQLTASAGLVTQVADALEKAQEWTDGIDILLAQFTTFVDARFIAAMAQQLRTPVVLWAIREPNQRPGDRLSLNSLTGANLAGQRLHQSGTPFQFLYGSPEDARLADDLDRALRFWSAWRRMQQFTVITIGDAPDGFHFSTPGDAAREQLGVKVRHLDLNDTFQRALAVPDSEVQSEVERVKTKVRGLAQLPRDSIVKFGRLMSVLREDLQSLGADAVAVRCWPEFFTEFGAAACSMVSALTDEGIMGSCEADIFGALSMDILHELSGSAAYLGDLVEVDETRQTVVFWHCGAGAFSLARSDTGAAAGKHPNRDLGFTLEFGLKPGPVTILRIGESRDGSVRALIGEGDVVDEPQRFRGTSGKVRLAGDGDVVARVTRVIEQGFEPHYALAYGRVAKDLHRLCELRNIPTADM